MVERAALRELPGLEAVAEEIRAKGKGIAVDNVHYLGDDLWAICSRGGLQ